MRRKAGIATYLSYWTIWSSHHDHGKRLDTWQPCLEHLAQPLCCFTAIHTQHHVMSKRSQPIYSWCINSTTVGTKYEQQRAFMLYHCGQFMPFPLSKLMQLSKSTWKASFTNTLIDTIHNLYNTNNRTIYTLSFKSDRQLFLSNVWHYAEYIATLFSHTCQGSKVYTFSSHFFVFLSPQSTPRADSEERLRYKPIIIMLPPSTNISTTIITGSRNNCIL